MMIARGATGATGAPATNAELIARPATPIRRRTERSACYDRQPAATGRRIMRKKSPDLDTERWVEQAQAGDVNAFEELYQLHAGRVYALCLRMSGDA
ncbi:MAG: hypothetical protein AAF657_34020, partial [Acidobacteriota bacterium]